MDGRVLAIAHVDAWAENRVMAALRGLGASVEIVRIERGERVPRRASDYAGIVVGGGLAPVSMAHRYPFLGEEIGLIADAVARGIPFLGICLGAQLLAASLGETAVPAADHRAELGYHRITGLDPSMAFPEYVFQWHWEGVALPDGAELLARGEHFPTQAFRYRETAYGLQFHPCIGTDEIASWVASFPASRLPGPRGALVREQQALAEEHDPAVRRWLDRFLPRWLGGAV